MDNLIETQESISQATVRKAVKCMKVCAAAAVLALSSQSCIKDRMPRGTDISAGDPIPEFTVTMSDGSEISFSDLYGSVSCIVFFHTGCPDCQKALPSIQRLYNTYAIPPESTDSGVKFLCISREEDGASVAGYWEENGFTLPYSAQEDRTIYNLFATFTVPRIYLSDREGIIRAIYTDNPVPEYEELEQDVRALLGGNEL